MWFHVLFKISRLYNLNDVIFYFIKYYIFPIIFVFMFPRHIFFTFSFYKYFQPPYLQTPLGFPCFLCPADWSIKYTLSGSLAPHSLLGRVKLNTRKEQPFSWYNSKQYKLQQLLFWKCILCIWSWRKKWSKNPRDSFLPLCSFGELNTIT